MYFLKWIMADKMYGVYQPNGKSWGWGGRRDSIDEYGNQNQHDMKGQSGSSMLTFVVLLHMYVPDMLHAT